MGVVRREQWRRRAPAWWLDAPTRFFTRQCRALGLEFSEDIAVVFERFELVWPPG